jgi:hypothetical protein
VTEPWNLESLVIQDSILVCSPDPRIPHTALTYKSDNQTRYNEIHMVLLYMPQLGP